MREKSTFNTYGGNPVRWRPVSRSWKPSNATINMTQRQVQGDRLAAGFDKLVRDHKIVGEHPAKA